ncbi:hypothetical protein [Nostoc sp.]|uniref:hypothetical protein n=1 Tax=Nostoc sp. TaxID=1180 RepID=UPI002FFC3200
MTFSTSREKSDSKQGLVFSFPSAVAFLTQKLPNRIFAPDFLPTPHISRTFGSNRENRLATLCFKSDVYDGLSGVATLSIPRFPYSATHHQQPCLLAAVRRSSKSRMPGVAKK